jgi:dCMP deaminase
MASVTDLMCDFVTSHFGIGNDRIAWDDYFMCMALLASSRSPCKRLHVGCVIVKDNRIISTGYNGFLPGHEHVSVVEGGHELATVHAEQNAIFFGAKHGIKINGATAYVTHYPCLYCAKALESAGIYRVFYHSDYKNDPLVAKICSKLETKQI